MEASGKLMPLLALRGIIVFPGMTVNLDVGRDKSINAVNAAMQLDKKILLVTQRELSAMPKPQTRNAKNCIIMALLPKLSSF